jgi:adenine-specific DNA-methyltransferase
MRELDRIDETSPDMKAELLARLKSVVPEAFSDGQLDLDRLAELAGDAVATGAERYGLTWPGKREAIAMLQAPSRATLVPERDQSVNFDDARHVFIEGENLEVLKLLYKSYFGRVKLIYIDPPYNTGNDFIYHDDFSDPLAAYLRQTGQMTEDGDMTTSVPEKNGRRHSSWLSMMYPRLAMARQFLTVDGLIFVSIDENEVHNLRLLMNDVFGEENFVSEICWRKAYGGGAKAKYIVVHHEYVLVYAHTKSKISRIDLPPNPETRKYYKFRDSKFERLGPYRTQPLWTNSMDERKNLRYAIPFKGKEVWPEKQWQWEKARVLEAIENDCLEFIETESGVSVYYKQYLYDEDGDERSSKLFSAQDGPYTQAGTAEIEFLFGNGNGKVFPFPKPTGLIKKFISTLWREENAIVMDFFGGSFSTAQAVLDLQREMEGTNLRCIAVQYPQNVSSDSAAGRLGFGDISSIARDRIRRFIASEGIKEGFRAFRLTTTNIRRWVGTKDMTPEGYIEQMDAFANTLLPGWKAEDVIWEVAVREGFPLTASITPSGNAAPKGSWRVSDPDTDRAFTICLADHIDLASVKLLGLAKSDLFICRDTAIDDTVAANLALQCTLKVL